MIPSQVPAECGTFDLLCQAQQAASSAWQSFIADVADGAAELVVTMTTWWVTTDSIDPRDPAVMTAQAATGDLVTLILVAAILVQSIRVMVSRKGEPVVMVLTGLVRFAVTSAVGLVALQTALRAADAFSTQLIGGATDAFAIVMRNRLTNDPEAGFAMLLIAVVAAVLAIVQWAMMAMRQAGLLVLAAMLPMAAAGSLTKSTRGWLDRVIVWMITIVAYKPAAAFIYSIGFTYMSSPAANDDGTYAAMLTGIVVMLLAVLAMPVMLKFFSWTGMQIGGGSGNGSAFLGAAGAIAMSRTGGGRAAVDRAAAMEASGPGSHSSTTGASSTSPSGAAPTASTRAGSVAGRAGAAAAAASIGSTAAQAAGRSMTGPDSDEEQR